MAGQYKYNYLANMQMICEQMLSTKNVDFTVVCYCFIFNVFSNARTGENVNTAG